MATELKIRVGEKANLPEERHFGEFLITGDTAEFFTADADGNEISLPIKRPPPKNSEYVLPKDAALFSGGVDVPTIVVASQVKESLSIGDNQERIYTLPTLEEGQIYQKTLTIDTGDRKYFKLDGYYLTNINPNIYENNIDGNVLYTLERSAEDPSQYLLYRSNDTNNVGILYADTGLLAFENTTKPNGKILVIQYNIMSALGNVVLGARSLAAGKMNTIVGNQSFTFGSENTVYGIQDQVNGLRNFNKNGDHNFIVGFDNLNESGANNVIGGALNYNNGSSNFITGSRNIVRASNSVVAGWGNLIDSGESNVTFGKGLTVYGNGKVALGQFNKFDATDIFQIGNGTGSTNRKTAFGVKEDGSAYLAKQGTDDNSIVRKAYVDAVKEDIIKDIGNHDLTKYANVITKTRINALGPKTLNEIVQELSPLAPQKITLYAVYNEKEFERYIEAMQFYPYYNGEEFNPEKGYPEKYFSPEYNNNTGKYELVFNISDIENLTSFVYNGPSTMDFNDTVVTWNTYEYPVDTKTYIQQTYSGQEDLNTWEQVQEYVRKGINPFSIGDIVEFKYGDGIMQAIVIGFDQDEPVDSNYTHCLSLLFLHEALPTNHGWFIEKTDKGQVIDYVSSPLKTALETTVIDNLDSEIQAVLGKVNKYAKTVADGKVTVADIDRTNWKFETCIFPPTTMELYTDKRTTFTSDDNFYGDVNKKYFDESDMVGPIIKSTAPSYEYFEKFHKGNGALFKNIDSNRIMELQNGNNPRQIVTRNIVKDNVTNYFYWNGTDGVIGNKYNNNAGYVFPIITIV